MSVEEDTELRDLVSQTLENNGVLAKIRAELRASVFLAVEEQESCLSKTPFLSNTLKEYLSTPQGALGLCLVKEFLEYLELDFTLSVFNTETQLGKDYEYEGRSKLLKDLQIKNINGKKGPLLAHVLLLAQKCSEVHTNSSDFKEANNDNKPANFGSGDIPPLQINSLQNHEDSANISLTPLDRTFVTESSSLNSLTASPVERTDDEKQKHSSHIQQQATSSEPQQRLPSDQNNKIFSNNSSLVGGELKPGKLTLSRFDINSHSLASGDLPEKSKRLNAEKGLNSKIVDSHNHQLSFNSLPPLDGIQSRKDSKINSTPLIDDIDSQENYDEDFQSTDGSAALEENNKSQSRSQQFGIKVSKADRDGPSSIKPLQDISEKDVSEKATNTASISEEIDDDTNSGVDDLLNSTASGEITLEETLSHVTSNFADYCEDV